MQSWTRFTEVDIKIIYMQDSFTFVQSSILTEKPVGTDTGSLSRQGQAMGLGAVKFSLSWGVQKYTK